MRVLVTGSIAYDILLSHDGSFADALREVDVQKLSVSFFSSHFARHHGGTGANVAWNLNLLNQHSLLVGTVGSDGGAYTALLQERGIDTTFIERRSDSVTATAIIGTDSGERQIAFFHPGADSVGHWPDLSEERDDIAWAIVSARDVRLMVEACRWCSNAKVPYLFDPGQQVIVFGRDDLERAIKGGSGVIANAYEWGLLSNRLQCSISHLLERAPFLVVTQGEEGCTLYERHKEAQKIPACTADRVVNPTGAGDAFRAGFLTGLTQKWNLQHCAQLGASVASKVVEQEGALLDTLDLDEVWERARRTYGKVLPLLS